MALKSKRTLKKKTKSTNKNKKKTGTQSKGTNMSNKLEMLSQESEEGEFEIETASYFQSEYIPDDDEDEEDGEYDDEEAFQQTLEKMEARARTKFARDELESIESEEFDGSGSNSLVDQIKFAATINHMAKLDRGFQELKKNPKSEYMTLKNILIDIFEHAVARSHVQVCRFALQEIRSLEKNANAEGKSKGTFSLDRKFQSFPDSTALMQAIKSKTTTDPELYHLLLSNGADPQRGDRHFTPLQRAILNEDTKLIETLIQYGVDINSRIPKFGASSIWFALHMNCFETFAFLLNSCNANIQTKNKDGSLLQHALVRQVELTAPERYLRQLINYGANVEEKSLVEGYTPFLEAVYYGRFDLILVLKQYNVNVHMCDRFGRNALQLFVISPHAIHHLDLLDFLLNECKIDGSGAVTELAFLDSLASGPPYAHIFQMFQKAGYDICQTVPLVEQVEYDRLPTPAYHT